VAVHVAQGEHDVVIPRDLLDRTWAYPADDCGARTSMHRDPRGQALTAVTVTGPAGWLGDVLAGAG